MRFIYMAQPTGVHAWELSAKLDPRGINVRQYRELAFRAIYEVLEPVGVNERVLKDWIFNSTGYIMSTDLVNPVQQRVKQELPLLTDLRYLRVDKF